MSAIVRISARKPANQGGDDLPMSFGSPANDDQLTAVGAIFGPEEAMVISFQGLDSEGIARVLASFPGARRCQLASA
jgi:hypothetical protein